jgi:predicted SnoaL-like aldol condensation-catalyzing enzyme
MGLPRRPESFMSGTGVFSTAKLRNLRDCKFACSSRNSDRSPHVRGGGAVNQVGYSPAELQGDTMNKTREEKNKSIVLEAFETLFNKRDYRNALNFWSPKYIQHSAHIPPGRDGLIDLVKNIPATLRYENQLIVADGDFVLLHGRFSGLGEGVPNWVVVDIVRMENGVLAEHWDVIQDEATRVQSKSGNPMFGNEFPAVANHG